MVLRSVIVVAALLGGLTPAAARGEGGDVQALQLAERVNELNAAGDFTGAAKLAAESAGNDQLSSAERVMLGGLARLNFELAYEAGGKLEDLCGQAKVMRLVAPLAVDGGALQTAAAEEVEARLERMQGPQWRAACGMDPPVTAVVDAPPPLSAAPPPAVRAAALPLPTKGASMVDRRRMRAGVVTLVTGTLLFAPMIGVLAYRQRGEAEIEALQAGAKGRGWTEAERARGERLDERYDGTTAAAAVLGATGAVLVVTGVILAATGGRRSRMAAAPWGSPGAGGLTLAGRF